MLKELIDFCNEIKLFDETLNTLIMTFVSCFLANLFGIPIGVLMVVSDSNGIKPNQIIHKITSFIVNLGRSIPFLILLVVLIPFTRLIAGTSIGVKGMIVPLFIGATPFVARLTEQSLHEVPTGVIDAATCMGCSKLQIVFRVYLKESIPSLIRGVSITAITLIGYSAMSGTVGGGGLGDIAINFGYYNFNTKAMVFVLIIIILLVQIIQGIFDLIAKKIDKKNR